LNKILESIGKLSSYILTSHERSCEQNGHGNTAARASIRFCFGGGFRLDFRLPIVYFNLKKIKSTIVFIDKIKIDFCIFIFIEK
jgi:hypothetical protein